MSPRLEKATLAEDPAKKARKRGVRSTAPRSSNVNASLEQSSRRLEHIYDIGKLFASFGNAEQPLDPALAIVTKSLPLLSAILIEVHADRSRMIVWPSTGQSPERLRVVKEHAEAACSYLVEAPPGQTSDLSERAGTTRPPWQAPNDETLAKKFIVIPLVVASRPPFGILQLEPAESLDRLDLMFVNAVANQLAIALDRDRAWQRDIQARARAEEGRIQAETTSAAAERDRISAESSRAKYELLADENAQLYQQAQQAVRAREQILAIVSHDLKSPLGTILLTAGLLAQQVVPDKPTPGLPQAVGRIHRAAESMLRLISDLLDFASIEAGRLAIRCRPQDPGSMLEDTLASFASGAQEKHLQLTSDVEPELPKVMCDRTRILQVLANLVHNATSVTAEGGQIALRVRARGHELLFAVSDSGPGIRDEDVVHLFERYWRGGAAAYEGTGLGLAIASGIVSAHGSKICVESELGRGTTFLFALPALPSVEG